MIYFYNTYHMNHNWEGSSSSSSDEEDELIFDNEYITNNENVIVIKIPQTMYKYRKLLKRIRKINIANYVNNGKYPQTIKTYKHHYMQYEEDENFNDSILIRLCNEVFKTSNTLKIFPMVTQIKSEDGVLNKSIYIAYEQ